MGHNKNLSQALNYITQLGAELGIIREDLSFVNLNEILKLSTCTNSANFLFCPSHIATFILTIRSAAWFSIIDVNLINLLKRFKDTTIQKFIE